MIEKKFISAKYEPFGGCLVLILFFNHLSCRSACGLHKCVIYSSTLVFLDVFFILCKRNGISLCLSSSYVAYYVIVLIRQLLFFYINVTCFIGGI